MSSNNSTSIQLTRIQKLIGKRMSESKRSKPCFYVEAKADVTELMGLRPKLSKSLGVKITSNAFLIRALALAV
ncbi:MAG: 2-oxo acid dehydrogenase subunit E2, partial [Planctomycetota bacterium]